MIEKSSNNKEGVKLKVFLLSSGRIEITFSCALFMDEFLNLKSSLMLISVTSTAKEVIFPPTIASTCFFQIIWSLLVKLYFAY